MNPPSPLPALALLFNALVWGLSWIAFKALEAHGVHPLWSTVLVYGTALASLLIWRPQGLRTLVRHPYLIGLSVAAGLTNVGFNWSVTIGDVMRVVLLFYLMPVWSILLAWWLLDERPSKAGIVRLTLALCGVLLVLKNPGSDWPLPESLADGLALMAGFMFALTNALLRRWRSAPSDARAVAMFGGGVTIAGTIALIGLGNGTVAPLPELSSAWVGWALLLAAAFLAGNLALQYGAARLPAQTTSLIMLSEVVFASVSAVILGASQLNARTVTGGAMIVAAALLSALPSRRN
ncbi:DMT family transporter [Ottowia thiooxydans]|uniref:DMT family transporter n=1 Tax=Ottowia thiooxydans TaxID=219182 RepID=UPI000418E1B1|nr:DMT family transporter [Ottowia thiooxydans]